MNQKLLELTSEFFKVDISELNENTTASDVEGWDSLAHATFIIHLEENLQISFDLNDLMKMNSMGELSNIINEKLK